ncbi:MAG: hypothetical protein KatS3mg032_1209 [Cyclobacteriaceae bacterium]|nr:MAG: hypothetical protein KatS3mg032_1209 [Cyclobacteriaceae bacterium]
MLFLIVINMDGINMKRLFFPLVTLLIYNSVAAQNIFYSGGGDIFYLKPLDQAALSNVKRGSYVTPHVLGDSITRLFNEFESKYVYYKQSGGAYPVEEKVVLKRNIYAGVHDFNKFLLKSISRNLISEKEAAARVYAIVKIGIKMADYDTREVEKALKKIEIPTEFENYLLRIRFQ